MDLNRPVLSLTVLFTAWKTLLLSIAVAASIAPDYDTSTSLFFTVLYGSAAPASVSLATRLTRWDALYFVHDAVLGKVYEQEWAFGGGLPAVVRALGGKVSEPLVAIAVANVSHFLGMLALYQLTVVLCNNRKLAFISAALHVLSPAGLFLSAPYAESTFSCLSFIANLLFALALKNKDDTLKRDSAIILSGLLYGISCTFRSNGVFGGLLFAVQVTKELLALTRGFSFSKVLRLVAPIIGGLFVTAGFISPQVVAWVRYCDGGSGEPRPWCTRLIPSIYTFVQEQYW